MYRDSVNRKHVVLSVWANNVDRMVVVEVVVIVFIVIIRFALFV